MGVNWSTFILLVIIKRGREEGREGEGGREGGGRRREGGGSREGGREGG